MKKESSASKFVLVSLVAGRAGRDVKLDIAVPHFMQNCALSGAGVPHLGQNMTVSSFCTVRSIQFFPKKAMIFSCTAGTHELIKNCRRRARLLNLKVQITDMVFLSTIK
jgi:hypothetical protein